MNARPSRIQVLVTRLSALALLTLSASTALAYSFTYSNGTYIITCSNGERGAFDGPMDIGKEGDTGNTTVHGMAYRFCKDKGGLATIDYCDKENPCVIDGADGEPVTLTPGDDPGN